MDKKERAALVAEMKADPEFMAGIRRGIADMKAGRVYPWSEVKKELGIEDDEAHWAHLRIDHLEEKANMFWKRLALIDLGFIIILILITVWLLDLSG